MAGFAAGFAAGILAAAGVAYWLYTGQRRILGRFFSFAVHEINTPITAVNMTILNLLSGVFGDVPPDQVQWIEMMREQVLRLGGLVGEMRDVIHLSLKDDLLVHLEEIEAKEVSDTAQRAVSFGCAHAAIPLEAKIPGDLPRVVADPDRLPRCLATLLFHARKFRTAGALEFSAQTIDDGRSVEFSVAYQGPPITEEQARRSLDLYFAAREKSSQSMTATGLGLGIVRELARLQGGRLTQETDGKGRCVLRLSVPAKPNLAKVS